MCTVSSLMRMERSRGESAPESTVWECGWREETYIVEQMCAYVRFTVYYSFALSTCGEVR